MEEDAARASKKAGKKMPLLIIGIVLIACISSATVTWLLTRPGAKPQTQPTSTRSVIQRTVAQHTVASPLYYPASLPAGFSLTEGSVAVFESNVLTYSIAGVDGKTISITEQPRPALIEEVKKTRSFKTPIGSGYIADLEGRTAGFLLTDKTLLIASPASGSINDKLLSDVLSSMTEL